MFDFAKKSNVITKLLMKHCDINSQQNQLQFKKIDDSILEITLEYSIIFNNNDKSFTIAWDNRQRDEIEDEIHSHFILGN